MDSHRPALMNSNCSPVPASNCVNAAVSDTPADAPLVWRVPTILRHVDELQPV
jgi:hypothetical protein